MSTKQKHVVAEPEEFDPEQWFRNQPCSMGRDGWHCATHDSAWDLEKKCQRSQGLPEPRRRDA